MTFATDVSTSDSIVKELDRARRQGPLQHITIPACPHRLAQLRQAISGSEPDLAAVARIATSDVAMSATLIRSANRAAYAVSTPARTIGQAMDRLGLSETALIMTRFLTANAIPVQGAAFKRFWERAGKRALAMGHFARRLPGVSSDLAYTYGLFCHVGQPVMAQSLRGYAATLVEAAARKDRTPVQTENANHRTDHAVVGALVSRLWELAPQVTVAIRLHHDLECLHDSSLDPEVTTLVAMGLLAEHLMRHHEELGPEVEWAQYGHLALQWLQWSEADLSLCFDELCEPWADY